MVPFGGVIRVVAVIAGGFVAFALASGGAIAASWQAAIVWSVVTHLIQLAAMRHYKRHELATEPGVVILLQTVLFTAVLWVLLERVGSMRTFELLPTALTAVIVVAMLVGSQWLVRAIAARTTRSV